MSRRLDLVGIVFGQLTVIKKSHRGQNLSVYWWCMCTCGVEKAIRAQDLTTGSTKSCGCTSKDWCRKHGMEGTRIYNVWAGMVQRCENPNYHGYAQYGARGISVCQEWREDFSAFFRDMGDKPPGLSLGRIDNDAGYSPENCRWETPTQQIRNRSNTVFLEFQGQTRPAAEWAKMYDLTVRMLRDRIDAGWSAADALTMRPRQRSRWGKRSA